MYHGFGVADESSFSEGVVGVVFAGGGCGHGPETGGGGIQDGAGEGADSGDLDEVELFVELCFHGVCGVG